MTRIFVAGHRGLVGSAICRRLHFDGISPITADRDELDLTDQKKVNEWFSENKIDQVYLAAARVGGIQANNTFPAEFIRDNLVIQCNVIHSAWRHGVNKLLFLGSSCIYPKLAQQPMNEESLLTGALEPTNESYAVAKIAGIKMCQAYRRQYDFDAICAMPTNLYGPGDNFHPETSHVLPALIRRFSEAVTSQSEVVTVWGTGMPRREFMHVDDLADAAVFLMSNYSDNEIVNVGWSDDISIRELAELVAGIVGYEGDIVFDANKPDGAPRKLLSTERLRNLGWSPNISLDDGVRTTIESYRSTSPG